MGAVWHVGDTRDVLRTLPEASVDLVMTSPPFLALRSYLPVDHPDKGLEIGQESNPGAFLDVLLDVVVELRRVLADHGSLCVELGDTYSGSGGGGQDFVDPASRIGELRYTENGKRRGARVDEPVTKRGALGWPNGKSLCLIPSSFAWALSYGRNPWTGRELEPWRVRNLIAWCRPNPPVGALGDKFRPATSYMTVACKGGSRYFDLDSVREQPQDYSPRNGTHVRDGIPGRARQVSNAADENGHRIMANAAGAPPLDYWVIPTHPYPGSHYATFPPDLCIRPVKAMCPERVCRVCGKPSERIVEVTHDVEEQRRRRAAGITGGKGVLAERGDGGASTSFLTTTTTTLGWTDCGHGDWRAGVVLDPFAGSGTTLAVATGHGRDAIGIDLDPRNFELARQRVGMFLEAP